MPGRDQEIDLRERFPDLQPISSVPAMFRVNGCGVAVYGRRDFDPETRTYIKTWCVSLIFIPVLALRAYRVADAQNGWYFIGREPLSAFAKTWNLLLLSAAVCFAGFGVWNAHASSEPVRSAEKLKQADEHLAAGRLPQAAMLYGQLIRDNSSRRGDAEAKFEEMAGAPLRQASLEDAKQIVEIAFNAGRAGGKPVAGERLYATCRELVEQQSAGDPDAALALLDLLTPIAPDEASHQTLQRTLLETLLAAKPDDPVRASQLAEIYEREGLTDRCESLLTPLKDRLGDQEGARILGQILAAQGRLDDAHALLLPYVEQRLDRLHQAESALETALKTGQQSAINQLEQDRAFVTQYESATAEEQQTLATERVMAQLRNDPGVLQAQADLTRAGAVVPVALEIGIVILRRGQAMQDADARRAEMERAEKIFLAIQGQAGETDAFRLSLGQVYYWLGKHDEGRKLFDELLTANSRSYEMLTSVSSLLREVGEESQARVLIEEAYGATTDESQKRAAAALRSVMNVDLNDRIVWLQRADQNNTQIRAGLADARGDKALREGRSDEAVRFYQECIDAYGSLPDSAATLNNAASACQSLATITGSREDFDKASHMMDRALALQPSDSILLLNTAHFYYVSAIRDIIGTSLDFRTLQTAPNLGHLQFLYLDAAGHEQFVERVRTHEQFRKALGYIDQSIVLAPKRPTGYGILASVHGFTANVDALRVIEQRLADVELDLGDVNQDIRNVLEARPETRLEIQQGLDRADATLTRLNGNGGASFAVAAAGVLTSRLALSCFGEPTDADALVQLAEQAHQQAPSTATAGHLINCLAFRAVESLARNNSAFQETREHTRRSLAPIYLLTVALAGADELSAAALQLPDVQRLLELERGVLDRFPDEPSTHQWALLQAVDRMEADRLATKIGQDEAGRLERSILRRLSPLATSSAFDRYWEAESAGRDADAREILRSVAAQGVPLPFDP